MVALITRGGTAAAFAWPDVADRVERGFASSDLSVRRAAARDLPSLGRTRAAPLVRAALEDPDPDVRIAGASAAVRLQMEEAVDAVLPWLGERDGKLKLAACDVARALGRGRATAALARALGDQDPLVRAAAADALASQATPGRPFTPGTGDPVAPLLGKLDDSSPPVRAQVARALARLGDPRAVVPLVGKVQDSVPEVRQAVARALGDLGDLRASQALLLQLRDNVIDVRVEALAALGRLKAPDAIDAIAPLLSDRAPPVRHAALAAMGRIGTPAAVHALAQVLGTAEDATGSLETTPVRQALVLAQSAAIPEMIAVLERRENGNVATSAAWVLGELNARAQVGVVVTAMRKGVLPPPAALRALALAGSEEHVPVVLEFLADPSQLVRAEAIHAAGALLDPARPDGRAVEPLVAALKNPRLVPHERVATIGLLGRSGAPRAAQLLAELTRSKDLPTRIAAIDAIGTLGAAAAVDDALLEQIDDADPTVRLRATSALSLAGGARARDEILLRLSRNDEIDRHAHLAALAGILARTPNDRATEHLGRALEIAVGTERDAVLAALGMSTAPGARARVQALSRSPAPEDRRAVANLLAAHVGDPAARAAALALASDADPFARAAAVGSLGSLATAADVTVLSTLARGQDADVAVNAVAALGRTLARLSRRDLVENALCPLVAHARPYLRANALTGLALTGARCGDGAPERRALASDTDEIVRAAAALAIATTRAAEPDRAREDTRALERCAQADRSPRVAATCRGPLSPPPKATSAVTLYVVPGGAATPRPFAPCAVRHADGLVRIAYTDSRGAVVVPDAPRGPVALLPVNPGQR